ncbi:MAG: right-handed parallel beta-helix repeat-containing protein [Thioalkalispiraceae bacterium]|jgi:hypothetical protein
MSPARNVSYALLLLLALLQLGACGGGNNPQLTVAVVTNAPLVSDSHLIPPGTVIKLIYSDSMDTAAGNWTLSGDMASESTPAWSSTNLLNDTLTITPTSSWSVSTGRSLSIQAHDLSGRMSTVDLSYDIYRGTLYYVSASAIDDSDDGLSPTTAKRTIMAAITAASDPATVLVESGTYSVSIITTPRVVLKEGVSLYGGYSAGFTSRTAGGSIILDISSFTTTYPNPNYAVLGNAGITNATLLDGFTIQGSNEAGSNLTAGLRLRDGSAPIVQNNTIIGGSGSDASHAIYFDNGADPLIRHNTLNGGSGTSSSAVYAQSATSQISANTIDGGTGTTSTGIVATRGTHVITNNLISAGQGSTSIGVLNVESSVSVRNNTIDGGSGSTRAAGLQFSYSTLTGQFDIENNIILAAGINGRCIETDYVWPPHNNDLLCSVLYRYLATDYLGLDGSGNLTVNANGTGTALSPAGSNNVSVDPMFVASDDWHLSASSPTAVTTGGLNGIDQGWSFTTDYDGVTRPASGNPWSMGAFEP